MNEGRFRQKLTKLLKEVQKENGSVTPDFILAEYIVNCLNNFDNAVIARDDWHGHCTDREFDYDEPCNELVEMTKQESKIDEALKKIDSCLVKCHELMIITKQQQKEIDKKLNM